MNDVFIEFNEILFFLKNRNDKDKELEMFNDLLDGMCDKLPENVKVKQTFCGISKKYELLKWFIENVKLDGDFIYTKDYFVITLDNNKRFSKVSSFVFNAKYLSEKTVKFVCDTLSIKKLDLTLKDDCVLLLNKIVEYVAKKEKEFFADIDYRYQVSEKYIDGEMVITDNLNDQERIVLALKFLALKLDIYRSAYNRRKTEDEQYGVETKFDSLIFDEKYCQIRERLLRENKDKIPKENSKEFYNNINLTAVDERIEEYFYDILNGNMNCDFYDIYNCLFEAQIFDKNALMDSLKKVIMQLTNDKELCKIQRYEQILQENLYGFYRIDSIKSLDIDISSIKRFEKSATEFLLNDDIWVDVDYR